MSTYTLIGFFPLVALALTVFGLVLLTLGVRGRPIFSSPRCDKCGYDLRNMQFMSQPELGNCPECGTRLAEPGAVSFGRWQRQPRRITAGIVLMILPWLAVVALFAMARSRTVAAINAGGPMAKQSMTTPALLASLKTTVDQPWDWQELQRRLQAGTLSQADADAALGVLIADLNGKRAAGKERQPLHWADRFITPAVTSNAVSPNQVLALAQAYYGTDPRFTLRSRARQGEPMGVTLNEHDPWQLPNMQMVWALTDVTADGSTRLTPQLRYPPGGYSSDRPNPPAKPDQLSGNGRDGQLDVLLPHDLPPGEHELAFTFEVGVIPDRVTMRGLDGKPGAPDKWPNPHARWQSVVKRKITVLPKERSPVNLVTDPARNPLTSSKIAIEEALVRPATRGVDLVLKFKVDGSPSPTVSYRIWVQAGEQKIEFGTLVAGRTGPRSSTFGATPQKSLKALAPDVTRVDILFEPDTQAAERSNHIEEIWGKPHRIDNVPLQRFDLGDGRPQGDAAGAQRKPPAAQAR